MNTGHLSSIRKYEYPRGDTMGTLLNAQAGTLYRLSPLNSIGDPDDPFELLEGQIRFEAGRIEIADRVD